MSRCRRNARRHEEGRGCAHERLKQSGKESLAGERRIEWSEDSYSRNPEPGTPRRKTPPCSGDCGVALGWRSARDRSADGSAPFLNEPHGAPSPTGLTRVRMEARRKGVEGRMVVTRNRRSNSGSKLAGETV